MRNPFAHIRHSLALRLCLWILFFAVLIFVISLGFLFARSRSYVREDAMQRATKVLNNTALRVTEILNEVEIATNNTDWLVRSRLQPDSIYTYSRRIIELNPHFHGCSIAFEPYYFKEQGEYFSAYSCHEKGGIKTEQEGSDAYRYFDQSWYKEPMRQGAALWVDPFFDAYVDSVSYYETLVHEMITSYCKPILDHSGRKIGVISTDLSLKWLSQTISATKPSDNSYYMMLGRDGRYFVHPDTTKLVFQTIFSGLDPEKNADIIALGNDMVTGKEGMRQVRLDGKDCFVFFRQLPRTGWSIGVVYPEQEIFRGYNRLFYIVLSIIVVGLLLMLFFCRQIVNAAVVPINQLARQSRHIAAGNFDERMPRSERIDAVGQLQNSFGVMQQSLAGYVNDITRMNGEIEQRNEELIRANALAEEAAAKKTAFMQDITHQVRTPLNIITGFAQVLREGYQFVTEEEMATIIDAMQENSKNIKHIVGMLITASRLETQAGIEQDDDIACNDICRRAAESIKLKNPEAVTLNVVTAVPDALRVRTNENFLYNVLCELLENANKFTREGSITIGCEQGDCGVESPGSSQGVSQGINDGIGQSDSQGVGQGINDGIGQSDSQDTIQGATPTIRFVVTDTGIGVAEEDHQRIFAQFTKLDDFTEGIGLGLTLGKRVALMLGGDLTIDALHTGGARFILTLPLRQTA